MFSADLGGGGTPVDPNFKQVALLLHGDGTNGAQNNTFVDSSSNNFTITRTGNVAQGTFSPFSLPEGQWSNYFDGSGDYLNAAISGSALSFGTGDFTVEGWFYFTESGIHDIIQLNTGSTANYYFYWYSDGRLSFYDAQIGFNPTSGYTLPTLNAWYHIAWVRSSGVFSIYANGISVSSGAYTTSMLSTVDNAYIGASPSRSSSPCYSSNVRIVKGTAVYTTNFTPPTSALTAITNTSLLTCQSNRFKDNSSNNFTITRNGDTKVTAFSPFAPSAAYSASTNGGSAYFDGSGDYLSTSSIGAVSGDFTIEFWAYKSANGASGYDGVCSAQIGTTLKWFVELSTSRGFLLGNVVGGFTSCRNDTTTGINDNAWHHWAICRSGSSWYLFKDGVSLTLTTNTIGTTSLDAGTSFLVGAEIDGSGVYAFNGTISNFRAVNGTALYTSNFTPPTAPLTAIANTQLLLNCTNAGIIDNAGKNDIETVGNAQISTSVKKYGTGSMYFDGSGDYLALPANQDFAMGTGDFTIECWAYAASGGTNNGVWLLGNSYGINTTYQLAVTFTLPNIFVNANGTSAFTSGVTISTGNWYHLALVRSSNTTKLYVDGVSRITFASDSTNYTHTYLTIGGYYSTGYLLNGYIDDLRITKGQALYTSNFTPPTQAFPNF